VLKRRREETEEMFLGRRPRPWITLGFSALRIRNQKKGREKTREKWVILLGRNLELLDRLTLGVEDGDGRKLRKVKIRSSPR